MLLLPWALLPTITYASNAWHEDKDCGCHNLNSAWGIRTMFERGYNASLAHRATDLKMLKEKSKQTKSEKKLKQALTYELWRSLRAYRTQQITTKEDAEAEVIKILKDPHRNILLVLNNRVYVHREFYERSKHPGHAVMVREACQLLGCPNVIYVLIGVHGSLRAPSRHRRDSCPSHNEVGGFFLDFEPFRTASSPPDFVTTQDFASETTGGSGCDQRTLKLAINKEVGYEQCGVLVPNSYFGGGHGNITMWASEVTGQDSKLEPFASRKGKAMYRGSLHPDPDNVFSNERFCSEVAYGNYARISAFASSLDHPDEVDAKCVDGKRHACKLPPPSCVGIVNDFNSGLKAKARIDGKFLDDKDYRNHKYLLNLPGAASGSYSKNLNHLWRTGSVVMQWVHPFVEWYRPVRKAKFKRPSILGLLWSQ